MTDLLIIGSDSFIARKFIRLNQQNFNIHSVSRIFTGFVNETVVQDLSLIPDENFKGKQTVINFAAIVHRPDIKDEDIYDEVNCKLAILNARKAKHSGVNLFIQMSTIAVYGDSTDITVESACNPQNPYATSKLSADRELLSMQDDHFKVAVIRPPMVYGGGNAPGNMMRLIRLAHKGIPLPFKSIDNKRDFINVNNLVQYIKIICEKNLDGIFLVSDHRPVSTEFLLSTISKYISKRVKLIKVPDLFLEILYKVRPNEYNKLFGSLSVQTNFPYEDLIKRHSVEEGIQEMAEWFENSERENGG